ncbi:MAG: hypothetical protein HYU66_06590 [Armatimonadetes bacterium]|nr:hypothetical protein [Armatimonadota bacterium]
MVLLPLVVAAVEESGPAKGESLMLDVKPFNKKGDTYCAVCASAPNPLVMVFVTKNDDATHGLLGKLEEAYKAGYDQHLFVAVVLLGEGPEIDGLKTYITDHKLTTPAAIVPWDDGDLKTWKLNPNVANTVVFMKAHQVDHTVVELAAKDLAANLEAITG